ncbi:MAG: UPF0182 family protein [Chloroflexi bacterium]|nr:UPF0182 family protein [Chloroflexota bacterium]
MGQVRLAVIGTVVFVALLIAGRFGSTYIAWLWFQSVGAQDVFATRFLVQGAIFVVAGLAFFLVFMVNAMIAIRLASRVAMPAVVRRVYQDDAPTELIYWAESRQANTLLKIGSLGVAILLAVIVGQGQGDSWDVVLRFLNQTPFGSLDPLFGIDIGFFVFTLPVYELLQGWVMGTLFLTLIGCLVIYGLKLVLPQIPSTNDLSQGQMPDFKISLDFGLGVKAHLSILVALMALGIAWRSWLDIYKLVFDPAGLVFGAGYADVNARWPALWLIIGAAVLFAVLVVANIGRPGYNLAVLGLAIWVGVWILAGGVYPSIVQRVQVLPSELDRERPFIQNNINLTNRAYALDRITEVDYPAEDAVTAGEIDSNPMTIKNIRLWDPEPLLNTYNQIQSIRLYYDFLDVDVDRYVIDGEYRQVMLSARELSPSKLSSQAQTWVNQRLQFTHGYGVAVSPVNEVTPEGLPELFLQDVPPRGKLELARPEIYFGESTNDYVIVKTTTPEFDYPKGDDNVYVEYQGDSGVGIGSYLRRFLFAWQFGDANILLADAIKSDSRILYYRNIKERAQLVAPFLTFDRDPYIVVADSKLYWVIDAYTQTDRYPYSQPVALDKRTKVNYMRNSVKVVVNAYDGSMRFYLADPSDPIVNTYAAIFPKLFAPLDEMPQALRSHLRYPQDLFMVQAELYRTYHMRDARVFYNKEDYWNIPNEVYVDKQVPMQPYYVIMRLPGQEKEEFALILPYTPPNKNNMITWLASRSDGDSYGKLVAYKFPKEKLIYGPMQIEARIDQDPRISEQLTLWNQAGSRVIRGNMIVIPIGKSNLYVEPIYLQSEQTKLPEMKRVIMANGNKVAMEPTVSIGLASLFPTQAKPGTEPKPATPPPAETPPPTAPAKRDPSETATQLLERFTRLQEEMKALENDLRKLLDQP